MSKYTCSPDVTTDLGHELIVLDPRNGDTFGLNATGRRVWLDLPACSVSQLADTLCSAFQVVPEPARGDVESLVAALVGAGLVVDGDAKSA
jgi:hypothetical protein